MSTHIRLRGARLVFTLAVLAACSKHQATEPTALEDSPTNPTPSFATANKPERGTIHEEINEIVSCGTFDISIVGTLDERSTIFFDQAGTPIRVQGLLQVRTTVTNLTTGESLRDDATTPFSADFATGIAVNNGTFANIKDGIQIRDIGRFVWDQQTGEILFEAGPHDLGLDPREPFLCQALA